MTHINQRRDISTAWASTNPVLHLGEVGWETNTRKGKLGDGVTPWNALPYLNLEGVQGPPGPQGPEGPTGPSGSPSGSAGGDLEGDYPDPTIKASVELTGNPTAPTQATSDSSTRIATTAFVKTLLLESHPVGDLKFTTVNVNPGTYLGGTWVAWGSGRVPVGVDTGQTEFNTVEKTGGAKTHTLSIGEIPSHSHVQQTVNGDFGSGPYLWPNAPLTSNTSAGSSGIPTATIGGGGAHNNLQPYITCYIWKRTA